MSADPLTIVLIVFVVIVLGVYYYFEFMKWNAEKKKITWPRVINPCPDYWVQNSQGLCENKIGVPTANIEACKKPHNFNGPEYQNSDGTDGQKNDGDNAKCRWASTCNQSWEGVC